jgi:hypothetical protein
MSRPATLIIGDIHTKYGVINAQILHAEETSGRTINQVFVLGDFGFFGDNLRDFFRRDENRFLRPVACIEGNHEDHGSLPDLARDYADVLTYVHRGDIHLMDPWRGLCLGGANYMDAATTPRGAEITTADMDQCLSHAPDAVDLILSHDCPTGIGVPGSPGMQHYGPPGEPRLTLLAERFSPRWWFFGHHHRWFDVVQDGTRYIGLPESWFGYALLHADGEVVMVRHRLARNCRPWWKRWFHLK